MNYETRVMCMAVIPEGQDSFSELATRITICDEGGGEFLEIEQSGRSDVGKICVDPNEWPAVRDAIEKMMKECRK